MGNFIFAFIAQMFSKNYREFLVLFTTSKCTYPHHLCIIMLRTFTPKSCHSQISFKLATKKGNDKLLPKRQKNWGSPTSFWREHALKNTLNMKNRNSLASKATVSVSPKILQLDIWIEMFSAKYCLSGPIKWI